MEANLTDRNEENQRQIQDLIRTHQYESERLGTANSNLEEQIDVLRLENDNFAGQIEDLTAKNQKLVIDAQDQLQREQQLHWVVFSNMLSLQGDKDGSLPVAGTRLFFKQQERMPS